MFKNWLKKLTIVLVIGFSTWHEPVCALTANQVAFEFRPNGLYRIYLYYTIPALKEFREAYVEFTSRKKAEKFYFDVLRGADFYLDQPEQVRFINKPLQSEPW